MIARIWSGESPLWLLLLPLSWLYGLVSGIIRLLYRLGLKRAWRAPVPVVVVGNLTAGGMVKPLWSSGWLSNCKSAASAPAWCREDTAVKRLTIHLS